MSMAVPLAVVYWRNCIGIPCKCLLEPGEIPAGGELFWWNTERYLSIRRADMIRGWSGVADRLMTVEASRGGIAPLEQVRTCKTDRNPLLGAMHGMASITLPDTPGMKRTGALRHYRKSDEKSGYQQQGQVPGILHWDPWRFRKKGSDINQYLL